MISMISNFTSEFAKSRYLMRQLTLVTEQKLISIRDNANGAIIAMKMFEALVGLLRVSFFNIGSVV
jgi:hypothetical protein